MKIPQITYWATTRDDSYDRVATFNPILDESEERQKTTGRPRKEPAPKCKICGKTGKENFYPYIDRRTGHHYFSPLCKVHHLEKQRMKRNPLKNKVSN